MLLPGEKQGSEGPGFYSKFAALSCSSSRKGREPKQAENNGEARTRFSEREGERGGENVYLLVNVKYEAAPMTCLISGPDKVQHSRQDVHGLGSLEYRAKVHRRSASGWSFGASSESPYHLRGMGERCKHPESRVESGLWSEAQPPRVLILFVFSDDLSCVLR